MSKMYLLFIWKLNLARLPVFCLTTCIYTYVFNIIIMATVNKEEIILTLIISSELQNLKTKRLFLDRTSIVKIDILSKQLYGFNEVLIKIDDFSVKHLGQNEHFI